MRQNPVLIEACVTSVRHARRAFHLGAHRVELCRRLDLDGLTPLTRTLALACRLPGPVHVLIRPRSGVAVYTDAELARMIEAAGQAGRLGAGALVTGALTHEGTIDADAVRQLQRAGRLPLTFHRAFDATRDREEALDTLIALGVRWVLTSGGAPTAWAGRRAIARLVRLARDRIGVIAAGRVRAARVSALVLATGVRAVHAHVDGRALERLTARTFAAGATPVRSRRVAGRARGAG